MRYLWLFVILLGVTLVSCVAPFATQYASISISNPPSWSTEGHSMRVQYFSREGKVVQVVWQPESGSLEVPIIPGIDTPIVGYPYGGVKPYGAIIPRGSYGNISAELTPIDGWLCDAIISRPEIFPLLTETNLMALSYAIHQHPNPWNLQRAQLIEYLIHGKVGSFKNSKLYEVSLYGLPSGMWISDNELLNGERGAVLARQRIPTVLPELPAGVWKFLHIQSGLVLQVIITPEGEVRYVLHEGVVVQNLLPSKNLINL